MLSYRANWTEVSASNQDNPLSHILKFSPGCILYKTVLCLPLLKGLHPGSGTSKSSESLARCLGKCGFVQNCIQRHYLDKFTVYGIFNTFLYPINFHSFQWLWSLLKCTLKEKKYPPTVTPPTQCTLPVLRSVLCLCGNGIYLLYIIAHLWKFIYSSKPSLKTGDSKALLQGPTQM